MDQHPVPQNISSYEFRLVGDMTLKQFLQLAGGAGVGLIVYRLPLPGFIKWPLVIIAAGTGALMAFVPIQGRPFTQWLLAFIKAIYAPTEFYWNPAAVTAVAPLPKPTPAPVIVPPPPPTPTPIPKPTTQVPQTTTKAEATPLSPALVAAFSSTPNVARQGEVGQTQTQYAKASAPPPPDKPSLQPSLPAEAPAKAGPQPTTMNNQPATQVTNLGPASLTPTLHIAHPPSTTSSTTTPDLPPPSLPNILTGLVVSSQNQPQEGAIVEIVANATGLPVRALRTSKSGTFQIATPLPNGVYSLYTDKDGASFDPVSVTTDGKIIQPIIIKAKNG